MKVFPLSRIALSLCIACTLLVGTALAEQPKPTFKSDKEMSSLMIRFGLEAFQRNRFKDAKYYFQQAVQADPGSKKAWNFYDLASMYTVAEEMKDTGKYVVRPAEPMAKADTPAAAPAQQSAAPAQQPAQVQPPATSAVQPPAAAAPSDNAAAKAEKPKSSSGFKIVDDEGC